MGCVKPLNYLSALISAMRCKLWCSYHGNSLLTALTGWFILSFSNDRIKKNQWTTGTFDLRRERLYELVAWVMTDEWVTQQVNRWGSSHSLLLVCENTSEMFSNASLFEQFQISIEKNVDLLWNVELSGWMLVQLELSNDCNSCSFLSLLAAVIMTETKPKTHTHTLQAIQHSVCVCVLSLI